MDQPLWMWATFFTIVVVLLAFDLGVFHKKSLELSLKQAIRLTVVYALLALAFNGFVYVEMGEKAASEFFMGWVIEKSLSLDNLFVFMLIFIHFEVPTRYQHRVLMWGIIGALALRGIMIAAGVTLIEKFGVVTYILGGFLLLTGVKMLLAADAEPDIANNSILRFLNRNLRLTESYEDDHFFSRRNGKLWATPLFLVLMLIEISDLVFAVDSIPAIFAITHDPYIIYTSNIFAILGLRAMYFALVAFLHRFEYLKYGLSVILVFIGIKMIVNHALHKEYIGTGLSLAVILGVITISAVASMIKTRGKEAGKATGWLPGSPPKPPEE